MFTGQTPSAAHSEANATTPNAQKNPSKGGLKGHEVISNFDAYYNEKTSKLSAKSLSSSSLFNEAIPQEIIHNLGILGSIVSNPARLRFTKEGLIKLEDNDYFRFVRPYLRPGVETSDNIDNLRVFTRYVKKYFDNLLVGTSSATDLQKPLGEAVDGLKILKTVYSHKVDHQMKIDKNIKKLNFLISRITSNKETLQKENLPSWEDRLKSIMDYLNSEDTNDSSKNFKIIEGISGELRNSNMLSNFKKLDNFLNNSKLLKPYSCAFLACLIFLNFKDFDIEKIDNFCEELNKQLKNLNTTSIAKRMQIKWLEKNFPFFLEFRKYIKNDQKNKKIVLAHEKQQFQEREQELSRRVQETVKTGGAVMAAYTLAYYVPGIKTVLPYLLNRSVNDAESLCKEFLNNKLIKESDEPIVRDALGAVLAAFQSEDKDIFKAIIDIIGSSKKDGDSVYRKLEDFPQQIASIISEKDEKEKEEKKD